MDRPQMVLTIFMGVSLMVAAFVGFKANQVTTSPGPPPEPVRITRDIFDKAEVLPRAEVKPGTFLIELPSLAEFQRIHSSTPLRSIITYGYDSAVPGYAIDYWLSRSGGGGVFYHFREVVEVPWRWFQYGTQMAHQGDMIRVVPAPYMLPAVLWVLTGAFVLIGGLFGVMLVNSHR